MDSMNPALMLLMTVRRSLERGQSVKIGVLDYIRTSQGPFSLEVAKWFNQWQQGINTEETIRGQKSPFRRTLLQSLERGLRGESIYQYLKIFEEELIQACEESLATTLGRLPFVLLVPLLLFQMPAFLILLFGPILGRFFETLGGL